MNFKELIYAFVIIIISSNNAYSQNNQTNSVKKDTIVNNQSDYSHSSLSKAEKQVEDMINSFAGVDKIFLLKVKNEWNFKSIVEQLIMIGTISEFLSTVGLTNEEKKIGSATLYFALLDSKSLKNNSNFSDKHMNWLENADNEGDTKYSASYRDIFKKASNKQADFKNEELKFFEKKLEEKKAKYELYKILFNK